MAAGLGDLVDDELAEFTSEYVEFGVVEPSQVARRGDPIQKHLVSDASRCKLNVPVARADCYPTHSSDPSRLRYPYDLRDVHRLDTSSLVPDD